MDTTNLQIADDARRVLRGLVGIEKLAQAFEDVGKLEQQGVEIQRNVLIMQAERDALAAERDGLKQEVKDAQAEGKRTLNDAKAAATAVIEAANTDAAGILSAAEAKAAEVQVGLTASIAEANARLDEIKAQCDAKAAEVEELRIREKDARDYLSKLAG